MPIVTELPPREPSRRIAAKGTTGTRRRGRGRGRAEVEEPEDEFEDSGVESRRNSPEGAEEAEKKAEEDDSGEQLPKFPRDQFTGIYPGLNDFGDALEAIPLEVVRHFTLLKEIDAKCTTATPMLTKLIKEFLTMPMEGEKEKREEVLAQVRDLIRELMPCLEEKMHVAGVAADAMAQHMERLEYDWELIIQHEFPEELVYGNPDHPGFAEYPQEAKKSAQAARSESRREAIAAKKAAQEKNTNGADNGRSTPAVGAGRSGKAKAGAKTEPKVSTSGNSGRKPSTQQAIHGAGSGTGAGAGSGAGAGAGTGAGMPGQYSVAGYPAQGGLTALPYQYETGMAVVPGGGSVYATPTGAGGAHQAVYYQQQRNNGGQYQYVGEQPPDSKRRKTGGDAWEEEKISPRQSTPTGNRRASNKSSGRGARGKDEEPVYCYCQQVSYGEMVGCDGPDCKREWFHLPCIGLTSPPKGQWFCEDCAAKYKRGGTRQRG